jgi:hypothetical protein
MDESVFKKEYNPEAISTSAYDFLTDKQHAVRRLWRIRRFLRRQVGLPESSTPPLKVPRTIPLSEEYDPESTNVGRSYDPCEQASPPLSPRLSPDRRSPDFEGSDYAEESKSRSRTPMRPP